MTRLIDRLDTELPVRGLRRVQADQARSDRWERMAEPAAHVLVRKAKKRVRVTIAVNGVGVLDLDRANATDPEAVISSLDALLGAAWRAGTTHEPSVVLRPIESDDPADSTYAAGTAEAWVHLLDILDGHVSEAATLRERAAVAETRAGSLTEENRRLQARVDEADSIAESLDKALAREADLAQEGDRLRHHVDVLWDALHERRRDPGLFSDLVRSVASLFRRHS